MARGVGGDDNVMGGKEAVINVGFKDDLGNILENASKLKEILDSVNSNFIAINSAVGITTNSMGKLASQTQRLVATTQQLRNEYQSIADASQRIGLSQSVSAPSSIFRDTDTVREALGGGGRGVILGGQQEDAEGKTAGLDRLQVEPLPKLGRRQIYNELPSDAKDRYQREKIQDKKDKHIELTPEEEAILQSPEGLYDRDNVLRGAVHDWRSGGSGVSIASKLLKTWGSGKTTGSLAVKPIAKVLQKVPLVNSLLGEAGAQALTAAAAGETGIVSAMGSALGPMAGAALGLIAAYKAADYLVKGATRYSGLTGGTGVFQNTGAAAGSETFVGMQARAWREGLLNMAVGPGGFQQIQEALLGAGYTARDNSQYNNMGIRGMKYENTRTALAKLYGVGLQDVDQNLQLMQLVVERGNGSLTTLMGTIDNLRTTALKTNASLKVMTQTMTTAIQGLIGGMNVNGGVAAFVGGNNAAAYANSQNTLLRGSGAPDYNNFITQAMMFQTPEMQAAGVNFQNQYYMMSHPELFPEGLGLTINKATDASVDRLIGTTFNVPKGSSLQEAKDIIGKRSEVVRAAMNSPVYQALIKDPAIYQNADAMIEWLATNAIGNPQTETAEAARRSNLGRDIDIDRWDRGPGSYYAKRYPNEAEDTLTRDQAINSYFQAAFGNSMGVSFDEKSGKMNMTGWGMSGSERENHPRLEKYYDYSINTGQRLGFAEKVLKSGGRAAGQTYFKFGDKIMSWDQYFKEMETNTDLQAASRGEGSQPLLMGSKEKGQKQADISFIDAAEYGGGGVYTNKGIQDMTKSDFADAVSRGLQKFNRETSIGLKITDRYD